MKETKYRGHYNSKNVRQDLYFKFWDYRFEFPAAMLHCAFSPSPEKTKKIKKTLNCLTFLQFFMHFWFSDSQNNCEEHHSTGTYGDHDQNYNFPSALVETYGKYELEPITPTCVKTSL